MALPDPYLDIQYYNFTVTLLREYEPGFKIFMSTSVIFCSVLIIATIFLLNKTRIVNNKNFFVLLLVLLFFCSLFSGLYAIIYFRAAKEVWQLPLLTNEELVCITLR